MLVRGGFPKYGDAHKLGARESGSGSGARGRVRRPRKYTIRRCPHRSVFAPGSIGNLGPGLDILGLAVGGRATSCRGRAGHRGVIDDPGHPSLPGIPPAHSSGIAARAVLRAPGAIRFSLRVRKGFRSPADREAAPPRRWRAVAANLLLDRPLPHEALLEAALEAEASWRGGTPTTSRHSAAAWC